ncbi:MAG: ABC transporter ATP-binding protein [Oscillospiraceae bacterium]|jgi:ABC-2 type transport system ATP-binding protein|nr:ABC transporter ATP-binding protein [Oscillospiraceae bacterium]
MILLEQVSKEIKGKQILSNITHAFDDGTCTLLRGHNGCGKTMMLRTLCGLIKPTHGKITFSRDYYYGVIIENVSFFLYETAEYNLRYLANIRKQIGDDDINRWLKKFNLYDVRKKKVRTFSLGMKQRLALCQAFMESPDIILLDEPLNALDGENSEITCAVVRQATQDGKIVVVAAHGEIPGDLCVDVTLQMENGQIVSCEDKLRSQ